MSLLRERGSRVGWWEVPALLHAETRLGTALSRKPKRGSVSCTLPFHVKQNERVSFGYLSPPHENALTLCCRSRRSPDVPSFAHALLALQDQMEFEETEYMSLKPLRVPAKISKWSRELAQAGLKVTPDAPVLMSPGAKVPPSDRTVLRILREMGTAHIFSRVCLANTRAQVRGCSLPSRCRVVLFHTACSRCVVPYACQALLKDVSRLRHHELRSIAEQARKTRKLWKAQYLALSEFKDYVQKTPCAPAEAAPPPARRSRSERRERRRNQPIVIDPLLHSGPPIQRDGVLQVDPLLGAPSVRDPRLHRQAAAIEGGAVGSTALPRQRKKNKKSKKSHRDPETGRRRRKRKAGGNDVAVGMGREAQVAGCTTADMCRVVPPRPAPRNATSGNLTSQRKRDGRARTVDHSLL